PGAPLAGTLAKGAFGDILTKSHEKLTTTGYDQIAKHMAGTSGLPLDLAYHDLADNEAAVDRLTEQMVASTMLTHGLFEHVRLTDETFITDHNPPRIKPIASMTPAQYGDFLKWARQISDINDLLERGRDTLNNRSDARRNLDLAAYRVSKDEP
ncbi:hypothetical protein C1I98_39160, partial [Spongiactinospora gelatinilytica]